MPSPPSVWPLPSSQGLNIDALPEDLFPLFLIGLDVRALSRFAATGRIGAAFARRDDIWRNLAQRCLWPCDERFLKFLASGRQVPGLFVNKHFGGARDLGHPSPVDKLNWRALFKAHHSAGDVLVVDIGAGYTKYGFPPRESGPATASGVLQLCSSPTHPADASRQTQLQVLLKRCARLASAKAAAAERPGVGRVLICEPFALTSEADACAWRESLALPQVPKNLPCLFCPQPVLALLAHGGLEDGIVVNIGQRETVVVPCLGGRPCREAALKNASLGASLLTQKLLELLNARTSGSVDYSMLTWCRDLKERHCQVASEPFGHEDLSAMAQLIPPVEVRHCRLQLLLGSERFVVPEILFARSPSSLPNLVLRAAMQATAATCAEERPGVAARLLSGIVVVGGTAALRGLRARLQREVRVSLANLAHYRPLWCNSNTPPLAIVRFPIEALGCPGASVLHGGQLMAIAACASGWLPGQPLRQRCAPDEKDVREACEFDIDDMPDPGPMCCSMPWMLPAGAMNLRTSVAAVRRGGASAFARVRRMWPAAAGTGVASPV